MPRVHVFVPTYRRGPMLRRALQSLCAQTFTDWSACVHNDDPADSLPARLVATLADPRIRVVTHEANLGGVRAFNRGLGGISAPVDFVSILEDDATWEPSFLGTLAHALDHHPAAHLAWCNQRIVVESPDGSLTETGRTVHPGESGRDMSPRMVPWGDLRQATGALMANGAMLVRRRSLPGPTPEDIPFSGMEAVRERLMRHPMLFVPEALATFTRTRTSARDGDARRWGEIQTLLLATFVRNAHMDTASLEGFWNHLRRQAPPPTNLVLHAALGGTGCRCLAAGAKPIDWLRYLRTWIGRPLGAWRCLRARSRHPGWWTALDTATRERFAEARQIASPDRHDSRS